MASQEEAGHLLSRSRMLGEFGERNTAFQYGRVERFALPRNLLPEEVPRDNSSSGLSDPGDAARIVAIARVLRQRKVPSNYAWPGARDLQASGVERDVLRPV